MTRINLYWSLTLVFWVVLLAHFEDGCHGYRMFFNRRHPFGQSQNQGLDGQKMPTRDKGKIQIQIHGPGGSSSSGAAAGISGKQKVVSTDAVKVHPPPMVGGTAGGGAGKESRFPFLRQDYKFGNAQFPSHTKSVVGVRGRQEYKVRGQRLRRHVICKSHWSKCTKATECCSSLCHSGRCMYPHMN